MSVRRACKVAGLSQAGWYYRPVESRLNSRLRVRMRELAKQRPAFGSPRMTVLLRREYGAVNHTRIERLYADEGLQLPRRLKRRRRGVSRSTPATVPTAPRQRGSMDFAHDILSDGRRIRILVVVDDFTRECLAMEVDTSLSGQRVARVLERVRRESKLPQTIVCDNGTEFTSRAMLKWAEAHARGLHFITPGRPTENPYVESFIGKFRYECLRQHWFDDLVDARAKIEIWREDYNHVRPHRSLGQRTPAEVLKRHEINPGLSHQML